MHIVPAYPPADSPAFTPELGRADSEADASAHWRSAQSCSTRLFSCVNAFAPIEERRSLALLFFLVSTKRGGSSSRDAPRES